LRHNELGGVWLVVDGMILDVKRWLPEHPGGDRIIPAQSLNAEAARHFELYHSSRESFLYLKHFYVGEVRAEDVGKMPLVPGPPASEDFKRQLREYTEDFRISSKASPEDDDDERDEGEGGKVHVHLGAKAR
jgi:cytochrome b involved in lipid metabolism